MEYSILNDLLFKTTSILFKPLDPSTKLVYRMPSLSEFEKIDGEYKERDLKESKDKETKDKDRDAKPKDGEIKEKEKDVKLPKEPEKIKVEKEPVKGKQEPKKEGPITVEGWMTKGAKVKIEQSMKKLGITTDMINATHLLATAYSELVVIKKQVKGELKSYDQEFLSLFKRAPNRAEKECMRPLYMYYKKLKQLMTKKQGESGTEINKLSVTKPGIKHPIKQGESEPQKNALIGLEAVKLQSKEIIQAKLMEIKKERASLRVVLDNFQKDFISKNNRKIKYNKDIAPVADEFKIYKEMKRAISELEEIVSKR